jgi:hypothetical protein
MASVFISISKNDLGQKENLSHRRFLSTNKSAWRWSVLLAVAKSWLKKS